MTFNGWAQILVFCLVVTGLARPLGGYMTRVFAGERTLLSPLLGPAERALYRLAGIEAGQEQHWLSYLGAIVLFHFAGFVILYAILRGQGVLPFNPAAQGAVEPGLAFNTAASFITNTNWQNYGGESTLSYLTQMLGLTHQNFLSAATGIAIRGGRDPRLFPRFRPHGRLVLGRRHPLYALRAAAHLHSLRPVPGLAGDPADARRLRGCDHAGGRQAADRARARGQPGGDQDARHQRRRLLQRQRRPPLREPDRPVELRADGLDLRDRGGAHQRLRPDGRIRAPGLGDLRCDGRAVPGRRLRALPGRGRRQPADPCARRRRRQLRGQGGCASAWPPRRSSPRSQPTPPAAPSTPCTTASPRSAAWCPSSTCSSARSSLAASAPGSTA